MVILLFWHSVLPRELGSVSLACACLIGKLTSHTLFARLMRTPVSLLSNFLLFLNKGDEGRYFWSYFYSGIHYSQESYKTRPKRRFESTNE